MYKCYSLRIFNIVIYYSKLSLQLFNHIVIIIKVTNLTPVHKKKQYMLLALQVLIYPRIFHLFFLHCLSIVLNESVFLHRKTLNTKIGFILQLWFQKQQILSNFEKMYKVVHFVYYIKFLIRINYFCKQNTLMSISLT